LERISGAFLSAHVFAVRIRVPNSELPNFAPLFERTLRVLVPKGNSLLVDYSLFMGDFSVVDNMNLVSLLSERVPSHIPWV
jgi:hypothetical protein